MRAHVSDGSGLAGCPGGSDRRRTAHLTRGATSDESPANLARDAKLATCESPRPSDGLTRAPITRGLGLE